MPKGVQVPTIPPPGDPGYNPDRFMAHLINLGLREARTVGFGLPLVNALQAIYPDVDRTTLGSAAGIVGQGVRSAITFRDWPANEPIPIEGLPIVPPIFFHGVETERVVALADATFTAAKGQEPITWRVDVNFAEGATLQEIIDLIINRLIQEVESPDLAKIEQTAVNQAVLFFLGRRF